VITGRGSERFAELVDGASTGGVRSSSYADLLDVVDALRSVPDPTPDPAFVTSLRERLVAEAESVLREAADQRLATEARLRLGDRSPADRRVPRRRRRRAAAAVAGVVLVGTGASMAVAAQSTLPGDRLYPLKRGLESAHAQLTFDRAARGRVLLDSASTRLDEVQALSTHGASTAQVEDTLDAFRQEAVAGADLLVADYQATGDESSMTTLRSFTADSMARLRELQTVVPAGSLDDLLQAAQALDQVEQVSVHTCSSCPGPLIGSVPPVLTRSMQAARDSWRVANPAPAGPDHGRHHLRAGAIELPTLDGSLPPASVTDPDRTDLEPSPPSAVDVQHTLQHLTGDLTGKKQRDLGTTVTDTTHNLLDAVGAVGDTVTGTLDDTVDHVRSLLPGAPPSGP
jgi:hypothetical protein